MKRIIKLVIVVISVVLCLYQLPAYASSATYAGGATMDNGTHLALEDLEAIADRVSYENAQFVDIDENGIVEYKTILETNSISLFSMDDGAADSDDITAIGILKIVPLTEEAQADLKENVLNSTSGQITQSAVDSAQCVVLTNTTIWERDTNFKGGIKRLLAVKGDLNAGGSGNYVGSGVYITANRLTCGAMGYGPDPITVNFSKNVTLENSKRSYFYAVTSPWIYETLGGELGQNWKVALKRGDGNPWFVELVNNIPASLPS